MTNGLLVWLILLMIFYIAYALDARSGKEGRSSSSKPDGTMAALKLRLAPMLVITDRKTRDERMMRL
jgi:hypothetical protein